MVLSNVGKIVTAGRLCVSFWGGGVVKLCSVFPLFFFNTLKKSKFDVIFLHPIIIQPYVCTLKGLILGRGSSPSHPRSLTHIEGHFRVSLQQNGKVFGLWEETRAPGENPHKNPKEKTQKKKKIPRESFLYEATMPTAAATMATPRQL